MELRIKRFCELTAEELYAILRLRVSVFVVEQQCAYPELDGLDRDALHVWLEDEDGIEAYLRVLDKGVESEYCAIGRVISVKRRCGLGSRILQEGVRAARDAEHSYTNFSGLCDGQKGSVKFVIETEEIDADT